MSAFQNGMRIGADIYDSNEKERRQKVLDERAARDDARKQEQLAREDEAYINLGNVNKGIGNQGAQIQETYGMTPKQVQSGMQKGGINGLREKLATYDQPDSYDLQGAAGPDGSPLPVAAAPGGIKPRYTADQLQDKKATDLDKEKALGDIALARRDDQGIRSSQAAQKGLEYEQGFKAKLVGFTGSPEQMKQVSDSIHTASPNIQVSTRDEQGFVTMSVIKPDKTKDVFRLSPQQQAMLYAGANMFNEDPERSMKIMGGVNASLGEVLSKESDSIFKVNKENNDTAGEKGKLGLLGQKISAAGASRGAGTGKPEVEPIEGRLKALIQDDKNMDAGQKAIAYDYAVTASKLPGMTPEKALRVAVASLGQEPDAKGSKVFTKLNPATGTWDHYFSDPQIMGGTPVPLAANVTTIDALAAKKDPKALSSEISQMLQSMSGGNAGKAEAFQRAASDPAERAKLIEAAREQGRTPEQITALTNKLDLVRRLGSGVKLVDAQGARIDRATPVAGSASVAPQPGGISPTQRTPQAEAMVRRMGIGSRPGANPAPADQAPNADQAIKQAAQLLQSGSLSDLSDLQSYPNFSLLPVDMKRAIYNRVNGIAGN